MCNRYFLTKTKRYKTVGNCITMLGCGRQCKTDIGQQFGGFDMPLVSEDLSSMTVWTILYYTRYVGKLSRRSLSYLCPDLPSFVRKHYNRRSLWLSSSCERASFKCNKPQVCKYADSIAQTHTHLHSSEQLHVLCGRNHQRFQPDTLSLVPYDRCCITVT